MKRLLGLILGVCLGLSAQAAERVVTLGGSVTEIVYALGQGGKVVGDDLSSLYPEAATKLPRVGYYRSVPLEGVLALKPDLVLASEQAGPPDTLKRLSEVGVKVLRVSDEPSLHSLETRIGQIAQALGVPSEGEKLWAEVRTKVQEAQDLPASGLSAVLLMNRSGAPQAAGADTSADLILQLAGLKNVLAEQQGYKPLSAEGIGALAPEVIVVTDASVLASGGMEKLYQQPGLASTPAARRRCIVAMDDLLALGTGPRLGEAIRFLKQTPCIRDVHSP
ncbi:heme/hemin ABC transporter substrate-binding protein [Bordetella avium]|uniref:heme/hemin ABC transporter substrate-binding protein n=1 Tax=Bordetella avium TaxID=521 RepID=UPI000E68857E|nr:hemin ABC transporter substrate-binding protein [Bordetella avium]AZY50464.1 hemin ABC transporter substrate-binding protein [Bordetella avium]RIQ19829.1 hemin ABC transporter substrate-binding protein [Bordetella avium]RIQ34408.1 hemin ABC transporter substrate-binding protein [Bordetella avium]